jgi:hypothetical protein
MKRALLLVVVFTLTYGICLAGEVTHHASFSLSDLSVRGYRGYEVIGLRDGDLTSEVGAPQLPVVTVRLALPWDAQVVGVELRNLMVRDVPGRHRIMPVQEPQILSAPYDESMVWVSPDPDIYEQDGYYPEAWVELAGTGNMGGVRIATVKLYPLRYVPGEGKLQLATELDVVVRYLDDGGGEVGEVMSLRPRPQFERMVQKMVVNPEQVEVAIPEGRARFGNLDPGDYQYVIVTGSSYVSHFEPLAEWKTRKGVPATIVTTSFIDDNYNGYDQQERIRNFIIDAYETWGTVWVLMGGDDNIVPLRWAWAMDCEYGAAPDENELQCDLYFADLDGTWDASGNHIYGEVNDDVDMYSDIFIGRASCSSGEEIDAWVNKAITFERTPPTDYQTKATFLGEVLWHDPYTDGGVAKDYIDDNFMPPQYDPITKLYERDGNENYGTVIAALEDGQSIVNHNGHCWYYLMSIADDYLQNADMDELSNHPRNGILYSIGCWPAALDYNCIAEHWVNNPDGGGIAFVGNSRYGWGSPGNPEYGYSDRYDQRFFDYLMARGVHHLGAALAASKAHYVDHAQQENVYRWHEYQVNLLGDPEMAMWTDTLAELLVHHPGTVPMGEVVLRVTVSEGGVPLEGALVCAMKGDEVYAYGQTDLSGQVALTVASTTSGTVDITVTGHNVLPYEGSVTVTTGVPWVGWESYTIDDAGDGNGDGILNPGESVVMPVTLVNSGDQPAENVVGVILADDEYVTVTDSIDTYGTIAAGGTSSGSGGYQLSVAPDCPNGHVIMLHLVIIADGGHSWESDLPLVVAAPEVVLRRYWVKDEGYDGVVDPGESAEIWFELENVGLARALGTSVVLSSESTDIEVTGPLADYSDIWSGSMRRAWTAHQIQVNAGCPDPSFPMLYLNISGTDGWSFTDSLLFTVGTTGLSHDAESGAEGWTHGGSHDLWHITDHKSSSPSHSWYCGFEDTWQYDNNMDTWLMSPSIVLPPEAQLALWCWYDVTIYGVDGFYVEVNGGSGWETLDFIGSGGALGDGSVGSFMGNDWLPEVYDLSAYPEGTSFQARIRFVSDESETAEGLYIDDVSVTGDTGENLPGVMAQVFPDATVIPRGSVLGLMAKVSNLKDEAKTGEVWTEVTMPNGKPYAGNPVAGPQPINLGVGKTKQRHLSHQVPGIAPLGSYVYTIKVGTYPNQVIDQECFCFEVVGGTFSEAGQSDHLWQLLEGF